MKTLVVDDLLRGIEDTQKHVHTQQEQINQIEVSITSFLQINHLFTGESASAIRSFYEQCHLPFLQFLNLSFLQYNTTLDQIKQYVSHFEPSPSGVVREQYIEQDVLNGLAQLEQATSKLTSSTNAVMQRVSDLIHLPPISDEHVQQDILQAKKQGTETVEQLNELDQKATTSLNTLEEDLVLMNNYLQEIQSAFQSSKGLATFNSIALHYSPASLLLHSSLSTRHRQANPFSNDLSFRSKAPVAFEKWHNPLAYYTQLNATLAPTNKDGKEEWSNGTIEWESDNGKMAITKGESFDAAAYLGKEPSSVTVDGVSIRYEVVDDQLIIFKDNPDYWYYTQNAQQGKVNYIAGQLTHRSAEFAGMFALGYYANRVPRLGGLVKRIDNKYPYPVGSIGAGFLGYEAQKKVRYWGEIVGTPVPEAGTKEVLVYLSKDRDEWENSPRVLFTLKPDGNVSRQTP
ncbi:T7SS effector LXG polymorphic toxin (plasmid) [Alkalihalophilus sp. As8PL]|uniref:T7SS effector LXG polymorphic toxin n=1 Tax=Alkalihalophilus sp. As8PL TaxID=3237103 RepID=A0AB39BMY6_9BACI